MTGNPYKQYKENSIMTMTPGELIVELYDGCIKKLSASVVFIEEKKYDKANEMLQGSRKIIEYLDACLDMKYEISQNLVALYDYFKRTIVKANMHKDINAINELIPMITDLRNAFKEAEKEIHKK